MQTAFNLDDSMAGERARLVRLCARLSGDRDAAEDLAQETLLEAWRHADRLVDHQGRDRWLAAIARNVCLRWARRRGREGARLAFPGYQSPEAAWENLAAEDGDLTLDLEREELVELLDRALALLPAETRQLLVETYVEETPLAEIAARLRLSAGTTAVRLHRGRLALRRVLTTDLRGELAPYGLVASEDQGWQPTRIWCPLCGTQVLTGHLSSATGELALRCTHCLPIPDGYVAYSGPCELLRGLTSYRPALSRLLVLMDEIYRCKLANQMVPCLSCGRPTRLHAGPPPDAPPLPPGLDPLYNRCEACDATFSTARIAIALCLPEGRAFWRKHPRIRLRPAPEVEAGGRAAVVTSFESLTGSARLDMLTDCETYQVLAVHQLP